MRKYFCFMLDLGMVCFFSVLFVCVTDNIFANKNGLGYICGSNIKLVSSSKESYQPLNFNKEANKYRNNPDFDYSETVKKEQKKDQDNNSNPPIDYWGANEWDSFYKVIKFIYWSLIVVGVLLLLTKVFKINVLKLFSATPLPTGKVLHPEDLTDNIHEISFDTLIEEAVRTQNFRRAVRLYYLNTLKKMSDRRIIDWKNEKTNRQYLAEIKDPNLKRSFAQLTILFEYVWYGEYPTDARLLDQTQKYHQEIIGR